MYGVYISQLMRYGLACSLYLVISQRRRFLNTELLKFLRIVSYEYGAVLTTILPILFQYLNTVIVTAGDFEP